VTLGCLLYVLYEVAGQELGFREGVTPNALYIETVEAELAWNERR